MSSPLTGRGTGEPIAECKPENMSVNSDVNDGTTRLRLLTARYAGRHVVQSFGYQHHKPRYRSRSSSHDLCHMCGKYIYIYI